MTHPVPSWLGPAILALHVAIIAFNLFGLVAIPLGAWQNWRFVRVAWWRALHVAVLAAVALQALWGRACFLTVWQDALAGNAAAAPLIVRFVNRLIYWKLPLWFFAALYVVVFAYTVALWFLVPPRRA